MKAIVEYTSNGHIAHDGNEHYIFFLCSCDGHCVSSCKNCKEPNCVTCTHTSLLESSKNYKDKDLNNLELNEEDFEKLYFSDDDYDWWERKKIWNCRTNEWEVEDAESDQDRS